MNHSHLVNHIQHNDLVSDNTLHVVGVISNYARWHSRYRLYREWLAAMEATPNVKVYTVEVAIGDRHHEVTEAGNLRHLQLRTNSEIWVKENMINLGVQHLLPSDWRYVCWSDCDVFWRDSNWAMETLHQLQSFHVVQPWSDCIDLGFHGNVNTHFKSFGFCHQQRIRKQRWSMEPYTYAHSGFAWACTRYFWENTRGLLDCAILGSADHHMAWAMINETKFTIHKKMGQGFQNRCFEWEKRAMKVTHGEVGFVMSRIEHQFHGSKKRRKYRERWQILIDHEYDPYTDLLYDPQGLLQLVGKPALEHEIKLYNRARYEDSIDHD